MYLLVWQLINGWERVKQIEVNFVYKKETLWGLEPWKPLKQHKDWCSQAMRTLECLCRKRPTRAQSLRLGPRWLGGLPHAALSLNPSLDWEIQCSFHYTTLRGEHQSNQFCQFCDLGETRVWWLSGFQHKIIFVSPMFHCLYFCLSSPWNTC